MNLSNFFVLTTDDNFEEFADKASKDSRDIKKSLRIEQNYFGTHVYALALHENNELNKIIEIPLHHSLCISPEVYDVVRDLICVEGFDIHKLGFVPVNYRIVSDESEWDTYVPLPFSVIKRYITSDQKSDYLNWRSKYKGDQFQTRFIQVLGAV